jgi:hypothetical protein
MRTAAGPQRNSNTVDVLYFFPLFAENQSYNLAEQFSRLQKNYFLRLWYLSRENVKPGFSEHCWIFAIAGKVISAGCSTFSVHCEKEVSYV